MSDEKITLDSEAEAPTQPQAKPSIFDRLADSLVQLSDVTPTQNVSMYDHLLHYQAPSSFIWLNPEDHPVGTQFLCRAQKPGQALIEARIVDWSPQGRVYLEYREMPKSDRYIPAGWYEVRDVRAVEILREPKMEEEEAEKGAD